MLSLLPPRQLGPGQTSKWINLKDYLKDQHMPLLGSVSAGNIYADPFAPTSSAPERGKIEKEAVTMVSYMKTAQFRRKVASVGILALALLFATSTRHVAPASGAPKAAAEWKITDIKVKMFLQDEGKSVGVDSKQVITSSANAPGIPLLVIVRVSGDPDPALGGKVELTGKERGKEIFRKLYQPTFRSSNGRFYASFWIDGMRCDSLALAAPLAKITPRSYSRLLSSIA
ncbi:MAG TPA: hypothetical protein VNA16_08230 [Abditibacteriaceae bacterium]|nr:hypothetical protein [Abditibacteriaceae bacterium]